MNCTYPITCYEMSIIHVYCFYTLLIETSFLDKQCLNIIIIIIIINIYNNITVLTTTSTRCTRGDASSFFCTYKTYLYA